MYQLDSWFAVFFELLIVGFSLYNSFRLTRWWNIVNDGSRIAANGAVRVPSVADHYGIKTEKKEALKYRRSEKKMSSSLAAGDGFVEETVGDGK